MLFFPAETAAIRNLVPARQLPTALGRNEARTAIVDLGGSPLGGLLFGLPRGIPFAADAISYLISFGAIVAIRRPMQSDRADGRASRSAPTSSRECDMCCPVPSCGP